jgi:hypothetical protein
VGVLQKAIGKFIHGIWQSRKTLLLIVVVAAITLTSSALIAIWLSHSYDLHLPTIGTLHLVGVEAYGGDINSTSGDIIIDLGEIQVGTPRNVSFLLRSLSNMQTTLVLSVNNWQPQGLEPFMSISWNYTGDPISSNEEIPVRIDIDTEASIEFADYLITNNVESFGFSLTIQAQDS